MQTCPSVATKSMSFNYVIAK